MNDREAAQAFDPFVQSRLVLRFVPVEQIRQHAHGGREDHDTADLRADCQEHFYVAEGRVIAITDGRKCRERIVCHNDQALGLRPFVTEVVRGDESVSRIDCLLAIEVFTEKKEDAPEEVGHH